MLSFVASQKSSFQQSIEHLKKDLLSLRTSKASPALVENILVEAYGIKTPLKQLSNITIPEIKTIMIQLWDKSIIKEVEKSISQTNLNLSPVVEGNIIRINLPALNEETRKNLIKVLNQKLEQGRVRIRGLRDEIREKIKDKFKTKEITEDEKFQLMEELDLLAHNYVEEIKKIGEEKEEEIMRI